MRNIRLFVEFASVVMPGGVLLLALTLLFAPPEFLSSGVPNSAIGITAGLAFAFAAGHLLQGLAQLAVEPVWTRLRGGWPADFAVLRFAGHESRRYLTPEQIEQLEIQYPAKLAVPFPKPADAKNRALMDAAISHAEAFVYAAKANEHLDDIIADYKLNKGLLTAFLLIILSMIGAAIVGIPMNGGSWNWAILLASVFAAICAFVRMEYHGRKYAQSLYLQFLTTPGVREGGGKGESGGGAGMLPMAGVARAGGGGARGQAVATDEEG